MVQCGSTVISTFTSGATGPGFDPPNGKENFGVRTRFP